MSNLSSSKIYQNRNLANLIKARLKMENANQEKRERKEEKKRRGYQKNKEDIIKEEEKGKWIKR